MTIKRQHFRLFLITFLVGTALASALSRNHWPQLSKPKPQIVNDNWKTSSLTALPQPNPRCCTTSPIGKIDFKNFAFPTFYTLKNGKFESVEEFYNTKVRLGKVNYQDFTNDGQDEAIVEVTELFSGGSSSSYIHTYIYQLSGKKLHLLWQFTDGSEGYCGSGASYFDGKDLVFELFGDCRIVGSKYQQFKRPTWDGDIKVYSIIRVGWDGRRFRQKSRRVLPFPYKSEYEYYQARGK